MSRREDPPVRHELTSPSSHVMWHEEWEPAVGAARRLVGLTCAECGRVVDDPRFYRRDGRDLLGADTCEEIAVREVMES